MGGGGRRRPASTADPAIPSARWWGAHALLAGRPAAFERELHRIESALEKLPRKPSVVQQEDRPDSAGSPREPVIQDNPCHVLPGGGLRQEVAAAPRVLSLSPAGAPDTTGSDQITHPPHFRQIQVQESCNRRQASSGLGTHYSTIEDRKVMRASRILVFAVPSGTPSMRLTSR